VPEYTFVINPVAGQGSAAKMQDFLERMLRRRGVSHEIQLTRGPGDATIIARGSTARVVIAVGGDGTINEVANGVVGSEKWIGVIPAGSGNDFIKSVEIPRNPGEALERLLNGSHRRIDVAFIACSGSSSGTDAPGRFFVNGVGIGFDAAVAVKTKQIRFLTGVPLYLAAVFKVLGGYQSPDFKIFSDDQSISGRRLLIAVGNGACAGGGFYLTPDAVVSDGLLDVCLIDDIPVRTILKLLPTVLWGGHKKAPQAKFIRTRKIKAESSDKFYVHADGEIVGDRVSSVTIELFPEKLTVAGGTQTRK
jgi:YegS/Rv2252/BmrU family lipid kinase